MPAKKTNTKIIDVAEPGKSTPAATSRPIIVTNRPMIAQDPMMAGGEDTTEPAEEPSAPALSASSTSKVVIKPLHEDLTDDESAADPSPEDTDQPEKTVPEASSPIVTKTTDDSTPSKKSDNSASEPTQTDDEADDAAEPDAEADDELADTKEADTSATDKDAVPTKAEAAARQREAEMLELIASRQFFVPVEPVERRKADRTSLWLTLLVLVLAAVLIDLMLDANIILLVEKIPHTHFFSH